MKHSDREMNHISAYIDDELSAFENISVKMALSKHSDLAELESQLRAQKKAINAAFQAKLLSN